LQRKTRQREVIREVFTSTGRPLSPQEATTLAQKAIPSLGIATVYRALNDLVAEGWLVAIDVAGSTRYELAEIGHHHHFHCQDCDKIFDIKACAGNLSRLVPRGFVVSGHELTLSGTCGTCADQGER
jgi:Fur family ferric uptake transcriptional regulator